LASKLDKVTTGRLYRKGKKDERALFGDEISFISTNLIPVININELSAYRGMLY
jgi:hypothetical protein